MKSNRRIVGAVLVGVSTWLLTCYVQGVMKQNKRISTKKLTKDAVQAWEGEGGTIIDPVPRAAVA